MPYTFNPFTGNFDYTTPATAGGGVNALPLSGGNLTGFVTSTDGISASYFRSKQGIPNSADGSTNGYAFAGDGDTGLFSPVVGGGVGNGVVAIYTNNVEQVRFTNNNAGFGTETPNTKVTVVGSVSASDTIYAGVGNSGNWNSAYNTSTAYQDASGTFATNTFVNSNFFNLTGGTISGVTRINNNLTVFGNLTATGTTTFANTIFSVTSALSVVHVGSGPALWVGNNGDGDIASFYDIDQGIEILHVGGNNGSFPNVGVKTSTPNVDFTVNGQISANNTIWSANGNSNQWNSAYSNLVSNSAAYLSATDLNFLSVSGDWNSAYSNLVSNSAAYLSATDLSFLSVSGNWNTTFNTVTSLSGNWILDNGNTKGSNITVGTNDAFNLNLETNNVTRLTVLSSGNVGIGTQLPGQNLTVVGNISASTAVVAPTVSAGVVVGGLDETVFTDGSNLLGSGLNTLTLNYTNGVFANSNLTVNGWVAGRSRINTQSGTTYTLSLSDAGSIINATSNTGLTASVVGTNYPAGFQTTILQAGTAQVRLSGGPGITINQANNFFRTSKQWSIATLIYTGTSWVLYGDVAA